MIMYVNPARRKRRPAKPLTAAQRKRVRATRAWGALGRAGRLATRRVRKSKSADLVALRAALRKGPRRKTGKVARKRKTRSAAELRKLRLKALKKARKVLAAKRGRGKVGSRKAARRKTTQRRKPMARKRRIRRRARRTTTATRRRRNSGVATSYASNPRRRRRRRRNYAGQAYNAGATAFGRKKKRKKHSRAITGSTRLKRGRAKAQYLKGSGPLAPKQHYARVGVKRRKAAKKAAATRRAKALARSRSAKKAARTRRAGRPTTRRAAARRRRRHGGGRPSTVKSMRRARRAIRNRYKRPGAKRFQKRYRMRSNPRRRRNASRRRRNPGEQIVKTLVSQAIPVAASLYGARFIQGMVPPTLPGLSLIPAQFQSVAVAAGLLVAGHFITKKVAAVSKYRAGIMTGLGINLIDKAFSALAPAQAAQFGVAPGVAAAPAAVSDYFAIDGVPLNDNIALNDYVAIGDIYQEMGAEQDLGAEMDLGAMMDLGALPGVVSPNPGATLGGVSQNAMLRPVGSKQFVGQIPGRSFTKQIPSINQNFDDPDSLYVGMFEGGF